MKYAKISVKAKSLTISILAFGLFIFNSCCDEENSNRGAIIQDIEIPESHFHCIASSDTMVILEDSTYKAIFKIDSTLNGCDKFNIPEIDFTLNSVLVYPVISGGRDFYQRLVTIDTLKKEVVYSIGITSCHCIDKCESSNFNIVVIPKIESDYTVKFQ